MIYDIKFKKRIAKMGNRLVITVPKGAFNFKAGQMVEVKKVR